MKKLCFAAVGWLLLALAVAAVMIYAIPLEVSLKAPKIISVDNNDASATISWSLVPYSTSYRIYTRDGNDGPWQVNKVVTGSNLTAEIELPSGYSEPQVAVRACNVSSRGVTTLSEYSAAQTITGTEVDE